MAVREQTNQPLLGWKLATLSCIFEAREREGERAVQPPGSLRSAGVTCISVEMLPTSPRPYHGRCRLSSPGSLRSAGVTCISVEMHTTSPRPSLLVWYTAPRLASLGWGYVASLARFSRPLCGRHRVLPGLYSQARVARLGLFAFIARCSQPLRV